MAQTRLRTSLAAWSALVLALFSAGARGEIRSAAELDRFFTKAQPGTDRFAITGVVTHIIANAPTGNFVLADETGSVNISLCQTSPLLPGDRVVACGTARLTATHEPYFWDTACAITGHGAAPTNLVVSLAEIDSPRYNLQNVETTGIVTDAFADDFGRDYDFLLLKDGAHTLPVACAHDPAHIKLIDAHVRVRGLFQHQISSERKFVGPNIILGENSGIEIIDPPPSNPFDFPLLSQSLYLSPLDIRQMDKRSASGTVAATWDRRQLLLRTDDGRDIRVQLSANERLPPCGSRVTAVGYPETDLLRYHLTRARVRIDREPDDGALAPPDDEAGRVLADMAERGQVDNKIYGKTVALEGTVRLLPTRENDDLKLVLDIGRARIPVDFSSSPTADRELTVGCRIGVTGCAILKTALWQPSNVFPRIEGCILVVRRPSDIRVIAGPPWWTPARLAVVIALLLLLLVGFYVRNVILKRIGKMKLNERTQLAVELHDSLSQTLAGLACQIGASRDALRADAARAEEKLRTADQILSSCRTELRHCLFDLRNNTIAERDFRTAVERTLAPLGADTEIAVRFNVRRTLFDDASVHAILSIIRELAANAVRHGQAWNVRVAGTVEDGALVFSVRDNGCGFNPDARPDAATGHFGLAGIAERLRRMHGSFRINSQPGQGTKVTVRIPIERP